MNIDLIKELLSNQVTGSKKEYFTNLVKLLTRVPEVTYAMVVEPKIGLSNKVTTLALSKNGEILPDLRYDISQTPCKSVLNQNQPFEVPERLSELYKNHKWFYDNGIDSYLGIPLQDSGGKYLGHLALMSCAPLNLNDEDLEFLKLLATLASAELIRFKGELQLNNFLELTSELLVIIDARGVIQRISPSVARLMDYPASEIIGRQIYEYIHPDDIEETRRIFHNFVKKTPTVSYEERIRTKNGEYRWVSWRAVFDQTTGLIYASGRDFTENRKSDEARIDSMEKLALAQAISHVGHWALDIIADKLEWSDEIYRIFEVDPNLFEASYVSFLDVVHPQDRAKVNNAYLESLQNKTPYSITHRLLMKDGRVKYVRENCETFYSSDGKPIRSIGTVHDITELKETEIALKKSEMMLRQITDNYPHVFISIINRDMTVGFCGGKEFYDRGLNPENFMGASLESVFGQDSDYIRTQYEKVFKGESITFELFTNDMYQLYNAVPLYEQHRIDRILVIVENITDKKVKDEALRESEERYRSTLRSMDDLVFVMDRNGVFTDFNQPEDGNQTFRPPSKFLGKSFHETLPPQLTKSLELAIKELKETGAPQQFEYSLQINNKETWFQARISQRLDKEQMFDGITAVVRNISELKEIQKKLKFEASHDQLTGLINRRILEERISAEVMRASRYQRIFSVFMIDLDHFKQINDTYGHRAGDIVLMEFAQQLRDIIRSTDYAARYGGEEFVVILPETDLEEAWDLAERVRSRVAKHSICLEGEVEKQITISIGIAAYPEHGLYWQDLILAADRAMYRSKNGGRNRIERANNTASS